MSLVRIASVMAVMSVASPAVAESVSGLVSEGHKLISSLFEPGGTFVVFVMGKEPDAPEFICEVEVSATPIPQDECRRLE